MSPPSHLRANAITTMSDRILIVWSTSGLSLNRSTCCVLRPGGGNERGGG